MCVCVSRCMQYWVLKSSQPSTDSLCSRPRQFYSIRLWELTHSHSGNLLGISLLAASTQQFENHGGEGDTYTHTHTHTISRNSSKQPSVTTYCKRSTTSVSFLRMVSADMAFLLGATGASMISLMNAATTLSSGGTRRTCHARTFTQTG